MIRWTKIEDQEPPREVSLVVRGVDGTVTGAIWHEFNGNRYWQP